MPRTPRKPLAPEVRAEVFERDGHVCQRCDATDRLSIDHRIPVVAGGTDEVENLWVLCMSCNSGKHVSLDEKWLRPLGPNAAESLKAVAEAKAVRDETHAEYVAAIREAHESGRSFADVAKAAGVSRQAVRQLLNRA